MSASILHNGTEILTKESDVLFKGQLKGGVRNNPITTRIEKSHEPEFSFTDGEGNDLPFSISANVVWLHNSGVNLSMVNKAQFSNIEFDFSLQSSSGNVRIRFRIGVAQNDAGFIGKEIIVPEKDIKQKPIHVCGTYDGSKTNNGIHLYYNGSEDGAINDNSGTYTGITSYPTSPLKMLAVNGGSTTDLMLCNLLLAKRVLTPDEVTVLKKSEGQRIPINESDIVVDYRFTEKQGAILKDFSPNGFDATLIGFTSTSSGDPDNAWRNPYFDTPK